MTVATCLAIIPAFNEARTVADVIRAIREDVTGVDVDIVVIDDGSHDATAGIAIADVSTREPDLEDVFLTLTRAA